MKLEVHFEPAAIDEDFGPWCVIDADEPLKGELKEVGAYTILGWFGTNAAAWRWIDRQTGSPISRSEAVSDWIAEKNDF
jgi:hypothetical protein